MVVTRKGFTQVVANSFAMFGFPAEAPVVYEFPMAMFDLGGDLSPLSENIDKIVEGLTKWQPKLTTKGVVQPPMVKVQGTDYQDAVNNLQTLFMKNMWGDGLPINPPTEAAVNKLLTGTPLAPDSVISAPGGVGPRGGIATVKSIAVALAMAGGRPEYMPVMIATVKAITDPTFPLGAMSSTTCSVMPVVIVNGPMARQIRLGSGYGMLGPDPLHPAGEVIGRAVRYIQQDLGGAIPGIGTMAIYGGLRATNAVFAEDEEGIPKGWTSLAEDQGFKRSQNVVTVTPVNSMDNVLWGFGTKEANDQDLRLLAAFMASPNKNSWSFPDNWTKPNFSMGLVLMPRAMVASLASVNGYSKMDVKTYLWNHSQIPLETVTSLGLVGANSPLITTNAAGQKVLTRGSSPSQVRIVISGGDQSGHGYYMGPVTQYPTLSAEMQLPANWDALLKQAETDLGPVPTLH